MQVKLGKTNIIVLYHMHNTGQEHYSFHIKVQVIEIIYNYKHLGQVRKFGTIQVQSTSEQQF